MRVVKVFTFLGQNRHYFASGAVDGSFFAGFARRTGFHDRRVAIPGETANDSCSLRGIEQVLDTPQYVARAPLRIVSVMDQGPELLFRTPHAVLSAPYHTNVRGNLDALDFFKTTDPAGAENIARRDGINLVVCAVLFPIYIWRAMVYIM